MKKRYCICAICALLMTGVTGCQKQDVNNEESQSVAAVVEETEDVVSSNVEETQEETVTASETETTEETSESETDEVSETESTVVTVTEQEVSEYPISVDVNNLSSDQENMYYIMDALAEECYDETYNPSDANFFWGALYSFISCNSDLWADESTEMGWRVERSKLEKYATGLFEQYSGLMEIPESYYMVTAQDENYYEFMGSDRGMEYTQITSWTVESDGTNKVTMDLIDEMDNEAFATYEFTLVENSQLKIDSNQIFTYSVRNVVKVD